MHCKHLLYQEALSQCWTESRNSVGRSIYDLPKELLGVEGEGNTGPKLKKWVVLGNRTSSKRKRRLGGFFFNAKQESSITANALHHLSARLRKGGGPLNSAWRLLQLHWHRCPDSFSPRQQLPSLPSNIWVYLNTFRMYVLCKHTIRNRRNLWSWV